MSIGWYLRRAGYPATILERGEAGRGATWAAAGTLVPWKESAKNPDVRLEIEHRAHALWPDFVRDLEAATGLDVDYRFEGLLLVAPTDSDLAWLKHEYEFHTSVGIELDWLSGPEVRRLEPQVVPTIVAGVFCAACQRIDTRKVARALRQAFVSAGGELREHTPVQAIVVEAGRVRGVRVADGTLPTDAVVLAAGAWSNTIGGLPDAALPPVRPVKGQMLALLTQPGSPLVRHSIWGPNADLLPRSDGRVIIGATVEEVGFDAHSTAGAIHRLLSGAGQLFPGVYDLPILEMWAGFRPGSPDDAPLIGPTAVPGLIVATGHFKRGILLAPLTARAVAHLVQTGEVSDDIKTFRPARFAVA
jgi:glycine oxidase